MATRRSLLGLCLLLLATPCSSQQLFLHHNDCSGLGSAKNKNMNCANTLQNNVVIASVNVGASDLNQVVADLGIVDLRVGTTDSATMPSFWQFQLGGCSDMGNFLFSAEFVAGSFPCLDV